MFGSKKCSFCGNKINKKFEFCPYCGKSTREKNMNEFFQPTFKIGFPFNTVFKQLEKHIEKQFKELDMELGESKIENQPKKIPMQGLSISISSSGNGQPVIKVHQMGEKLPNQIQQAAPVQGVQKTSRQLSEEEAEKISRLPKEEPQTSVRRLTDRIIYEIHLPNVKKEDIIINKMHNSIEIKAFTKDKAYFKLLPISLPILKSQLKEGKLILELKPEH
jgi:hypothetical protein